MHYTILIELVRVDNFITTISIMYIRSYLLVSYLNIFLINKEAKNLKIKRGISLIMKNLHS